MDALEQKHALQIITHFGSLFTSRCSAFSRILVCSRFVPFCFPPDLRLQPCHQLCLEVKSSCIHLFEKLGTPWPAALNCSALPSSPNLCLSPSSQTPPVSLLPSPMSSMDLLSVFSPPSPHRHSTFSSINPTASMPLSSMSAWSSSPLATTSSHSTVHPQSRPANTPQFTSQGLLLGISLMFAVFILLLPLVLFSLSRRFCLPYQPPTRNQNTITHIPLQQFPAFEPATLPSPPPPPPPLPVKKKDMHIYENTKGTTLYAVSDLI